MGTKEWAESANAYEAVRGIGNRELTEYERTAEQLNTFLRSEDGGIALKLLAATNERVYLIKVEGAGWEHSYYLDKDGLRHHEHDHEHSFRHLELFCTPLEVIRAMCDPTEYPHRDCKGLRIFATTDVVPFIKEKLDNIASRVPA